MFKNVTKVYFDESVIGIGTKIHVRRLLSCELRKGIATNKVYDIDDDAEVINMNMINTEDCCGIYMIKVKFKNYRYMYYGEEYDDEEIDIEDVLNGEWEIKIIA